MLKHLVTQTLLQKKYPFVIPHDCSKCVQWTGKSEIYADNSAQNKKINQWCECDCDHIISKVHNFPEKKNGEFFLAE